MSKYEEVGKEVSVGDRKLLVCVEERYRPILT